MNIRIHIPKGTPVLADDQEEKTLVDTEAAVIYVDKEVVDVLVDDLAAIPPIQAAMNKSEERAPAFLSFRVVDLKS